MAVRWPMVGVKTLTGCSSVFLYWEFRVKSLVVILSSAKHQLVTRHNTTLSLVALLLPSFFYGLSLNLAFGTLECVLWRLENLAVGWRWRWVCLETVCDQFWHALPPFGGSV